MRCELDSRAVGTFVLMRAQCVANDVPDVASGNSSRTRQLAVPVAGHRTRGRRVEKQFSHGGKTVSQPVSSFKALSNNDLCGS